MNCCPKWITDKSREQQQELQPQQPQQPQQAAGSNQGQTGNAGTNVDTQGYTSAPPMATDTAGTSNGEPPAAAVMIVRRSDDAIREVRS